MRTKILLIGALLSTVASSGLAMAADVAPAGKKPAVSEVNGKVEFEGGPYAIDGFSGGGEWSGGASLSVPLGDAFGFQGDIAASNTVNNSTLYGGMAHFFTRDPDTYLFGVTGGAFWTDQANAQLIGPEVEFYSGPVSIQAYAGVMNANVAGLNTDNFFGMADVSFYATENFMFKVGVKEVMDFTTAHAGIEYMFSDTTPVSLTLDGKIGSDNYRAVDLGLKFYFGGQSKSLIRRHREDDPPNRIFDVFNGAGNAFVPPKAAPSTPGTTPQCDPELPGYTPELCDS